MSPELEQLLLAEQLVYITTYEATGKPGTVPVWFVYEQGKVFISTGPGTLKARTVRDNPRVRLALGARDGPAFDGTARFTSDKATCDMIARSLSDKYQGYWGDPARLARSMARGRERVLLEITPAP